MIGAFESRSVEVDGLRIAYHHAGEGTPVVLLHGYVGSSDATWHHQLNFLSRDFSVFAWNAPGMDGSSSPPESFRMPEYADCLEAFLKALSLPNVHLVGLSFGGALALEFAGRHPDMLSSLVLAGAYAGWAGSLEDDVVELRLQQAVQLADLPSHEFVDAVLPSMFSANADPELVDAFGTEIGQFQPIGLKTMARAVAGADLRDVLPTIRVPTLLVYGSEDARAPIEVAEQLHAGITGSSLVVLDGVGHASTVEAPDRINSELKRFLTSLP